MIEAAFYEPSGRIVQTLTCRDENELDMNISDGLQWKAIGKLKIKNHYVKDDEFRTYPERPGEWALFDSVSETWFDPRTETDLAAEVANALHIKRAGMSCSRMQGILALGADLWGSVLAYRDSEYSTFGEKIIIDQASVWNRLSENIALFAYLLNLTDEEVDDLFERAMLIEA